MQRANLGGWWDTLLCLPPVYRCVWCTILVDGHPVCIVCLLCTVEYLQYLNLTVGHHVQCPHSVAWFGQLWYGIVYHILVWFGIYHTKWDTNQTVNVPVTQQKVTSNKKKNKQQSSMQQFTSPPLQTLSTHTHHFDLEAKVNLKCAFLLVVCVEGCIGGPAFTALQHLRVGQRRSRMTRHF